MSDIDDCRKSVERLTRDRGEVMREGNDKIEEIRARHEDNARIGSIIHGPDRPPSWTLVGWKAHHDRAFLLLELDRLRAENERLFNEDTKTRHALKGWVFVCPDGGDEPTHERVAAVVAEVERLRADNEKLREAMTDMLSGWRYIRETYGDLAGVGWDRVESKAQEALEGKPRSKGSKGTQQGSSRS